MLGGIWMWLGRGILVMGRSIRRLRVGDGPAASEDEIREAALQFVRKISGYRAPSQRNRHLAVEEISRVSAGLLDALATTSASVATR